jgi:shikimate dehydrogenase
MGRVWRLGLVGHPIGKSLSPAMHEAALAALGLEGSYERFDRVEPEGVHAVLQAVRAGVLDGVNVTLPHKRVAALACDRLDGVASRLGVVNTVRCEGADLIGYNTDVPGLVGAVRDGWRTDVRGPALVIGAGGAAYAAVEAARDLGASDIRIWNRTRARAEAMAAVVGGEVYDDVQAAAHAVTLLLQASSHGMDLVGEEAREALAFAREVVQATAATARVVDLVYRPRPTVWVQAATAEGREGRDGLGMLVHQAACAFAIWTGQEAPVEVMRRAAEGP